jgi:hypothetical protein
VPSLSRWVIVVASRLLGEFGKRGVIDVLRKGVDRFISI